MDLKELESFKKDLRSVLIAEKEGIPIYRVEKEYYDLTGEKIVFNRTLYPNLESFLRTLTDASSVEVDNEGTVRALPIVSSKQGHIDELVQGQKDKKTFPRRFGSRSFAFRRGRGRGRGYLNGSQNSRFSRRPFERPVIPRKNFDNTPGFVIDKRRNSVSPVSEHRSRRRPDSLTNEKRDDSRYFAPKSPSTDRRFNSFKRSDAPDIERKRRRSPDRRNLSPSPKRSNFSSFDRNNPTRERYFDRDRSRRRESPKVNGSKRRDSSRQRDRSRRRDSSRQRDRSRRREPSAQRDRSRRRRLSTQRDRSRRRESSSLQDRSRSYQRNDSSFEKCSPIKDTHNHKQNGSSDTARNRVSRNQYLIELENDLTSSTPNKKPETNVTNNINSQRKEMTSNDPRRKDNSASVTPVNKNNVDLKTKMEQSFDVRAKMNNSFDVRSANKSITVKVFNTTPTLPTPPSTPTSAVNHRTDDLSSELSRIEDFSDSEEEEIKRITNRTLIRKVRDFSPDYRRKSDGKVEEERKRSNSVGSVSIYSLDSLNDYSDSEPLITNKSLRSHGVRSKFSVIESSNEDNSENANIIETKKIEIENELPTLENIKIREKSSIEIQPSVKLTKSEIHKLLKAIPRSIVEIVPSIEPYETLFIAGHHGKIQNSIDYENFVAGEIISDKVNHKMKLKKFLKENQMPEPIYEPGVCTNPDGLVGYFCNLLIGDKSWCTILKTHANPTDAQNSVSKSALEVLKRTLNGDKILLNQEQIDQKQRALRRELVEKIKKLFIKEDEKLYTGTVEQRYSDVYKQSLTDGWLDVIKLSDSLELIEHKVDETKFIAIKLTSELAIENGIQ